MTREQAINYLISSGFSEEQVSEVVRALTYEPTTKNDLGVDCIDRNYATRLLADIFHNSISDSSLKIYQIINWLNQLPSVTPQEPFKPMVEIDLYSVIKQKYFEREVLDKIRAEIEEYQKDALYSNDVMMPKKMVLAIIDKYKAETEGEDA